MRVILAAFLILLTTALSATPQVSSPTTYFIDDGKGIPGYESGDHELAEMALAAWARESDGHLKFVLASQSSEALLRIRWISVDNGLYGETQPVMINGKPGAVVNVSPSVKGIGDPLATMATRDPLLRDTIVYLTCVHEIGHAVGLQHTRNFADIMYSFAYGGDFAEYFSRYRRQIKSRADIARFSGLSPNDVAVLKSLF